MKKQILFIASMLLISTACQDFVDIEPEYQEEISNGLVDIEDYEGATIGIVSAMRAGAYYGSTFGSLMEMMGEDLFETPESLGNSRAMTDWIYTSATGTVSNSWLQIYQVILRANTVIVGIDDIEEDVSGRKNRLKAQALALRAFAHFDLLRAYGQSYDRNSTELGVPIKTDIEISLPERATVAEVYDQVYADINEAMTLFDNMDVADTDIAKTFFSKLATQALAARVSLYAGLDAEAVSYATAVIDDSRTGLVSSNNYPLLWAQAKADGTTLASEVVFEIAFTFGQDSRIGSPIYFVPNNRVAFRPSSIWLDLFGATPADDARYNSYVRADSRRSGAIIPSKYEANDGFLSFKALRLSEMYLIRAEAYANQGSSALASTDLNTLRAARITGYTNESLSGTALMNAIKVERRKELFMEGHRWFDIRRFGDGITRGPDFAAPAVTQSIPAGNFRFVWPIPQDEIDANPNMADQQNPNY